jgi:hypothetical protein
MRLVIFLLICLSVFTRDYPLYKQCDSRWGNIKLGTSSDTICSAGCLLCSVGMALKALGNIYSTPDVLNYWLTLNGGYVGGDNFVWGSVNGIGMVYRGKISNSQIKINLDRGNIVILNVRNGGHWVLATGYNGDTIFVNDPGYPVNAYALYQIV